MGWKRYKKITFSDEGVLIALNRLLLVSTNKENYISLYTVTFLTIKQESSIRKGGFRVGKWIDEKG